MYISKIMIALDQICDNMNCQCRRTISIYKKQHFKCGLCSNIARKPEFITHFKAIHPCWKVPFTIHGDNLSVFEILFQRQFVNVAGRRNTADALKPFKDITPDVLSPYKVFLKDHRVLDFFQQKLPAEDYVLQIESLWFSMPDIEVIHRRALYYKVLKNITHVSKIYLEPEMNNVMALLDA